MAVLFVLISLLFSKKNKKTEASERKREKKKLIQHVFRLAGSYKYIYITTAVPLRAMCKALVYSVNRERRSVCLQ